MPAFHAGYVAIAGVIGMSSQMIGSPSYEVSPLTLNRTIITSASTNDKGQSYHTSETNDNYAAVLSQMRQLEARTESSIRALAAEVAALHEIAAGTLPSEAASPPPAVYAVSAWATLDELRTAFGADYKGDQWADLFDFVADTGQPLTSSVAVAATAALASPDPAVRSAAGRALPSLIPDRAADLLEQAISSEKNRQVTAALKAALKALKL